MNSSDPFVTDNGHRRVMVRPKDAADILGVSLRTIWGLIAQGSLSATKIGSKITLIPVADLEALITKAPRVDP